MYNNILYVFHFKHCIYAHTQCSIKTDKTILQCEYHVELVGHIMMPLLQASRTSLPQQRIATKYANDPTRWSLARTHDDARESVFSKTFWFTKK
jgi:hypothetical protein